MIAILAIGQGPKESIREQIFSISTHMIIVHPGEEKRSGVLMGKRNRL
ncbi:MAG: hypothetical protein JEZ14_22800 [Marinilabiliaceae bacterium]|nr:hypothetical protein [Marinilabiliaceae bacterium]